MSHRRSVTTWPSGVPHPGPTGCLESIETTRYTTAQGVQPPTDEPGWIQRQHLDTDGSEGPSVWIPVTENEPENEPERPERRRPTPSIDTPARTR